ncbi:cytosol aminopeptidase [Streptomyces violaceorubidus]
MPWPAPRRPPSPCRSPRPPTPVSSPRACCWARTPRRYKESANDAKGAKGKGNGKAPLAEAALLGGKPRDKAYKAAVERAAAVAEELNRARDLVNTPPNDLNPEAFAAVAQAAAKEHGIKVQVLDEKALVKGGYGGILGVGAGSASGPRLVKLSYTSPKAKKSLAFVGKGITYDWAAFP